MSPLPYYFSFEWEWIDTSKGQLQLIDEIAHRWEDPEFDVLQAGEFYVIYELRNGLFLTGRSYRTRLRSTWWWFRQIHIWDCRVRFDYREITAEEAVQTISGNHEIPSHLNAIHQAIMNKPEPVPRELSHWVGRGLLASFEKRMAHEVNVLQTCEAIVEHGIPFIQQLRNWEFPVINHELVAFSHFTHCLLQEYKVDHEHWWGSKNEIPPERVRLWDLPWPKGFEAGRNVITALRDRFEPALTVLVCRFRAGDSEGPTFQEKRIATDFLKAELPFAEEQIVALRKTIHAVKNPPAASNEDKTAGPLKEPTADACHIYRIWLLLGGKQDEIAARFSKETKKPMTQGQVSRHVSSVKTWLEAGKVLPDIEPQPITAIETMDPAKLDLGAHRENRPKHQRGKSGE